MLSAHNISYRAGRRLLLDDLSLDFEPGKINLILGPNGAGKSTLVKILSGQLQPQRGEVRYAGRDIRQMDAGQLAQCRAVLSQNLELAFPLSVGEVVMMGRYPHFSSGPGEKDKTICCEAMTFFDVLDLKDRNFNTLSGGEKQRVHFARVAAQVWEVSPGSARFLLLDKPLTFLDVYYQFDFMNKLLQLAQSPGLTIAGVMHDLNLAGKYADRLLLLHQGRLVAAGSKEQVLSPENILKAYNLEAEIQKTGNQIRLYF